MRFIDDKIIDVTTDVKWIGVTDYDIRTFDIVMKTEYGTTYNSYFINAEKKTIIELAKEKFSKTYIEKLKKSKIQIIEGHSQEHLKDTDVLCVTPAAFFQNSIHPEIF